jgi:hypothetical protein
MPAQIDKGKSEEAHSSSWAPFVDSWWLGKGRDAWAKGYTAPPTYLFRSN